MFWRTGETKQGPEGTRRRRGGALVEFAITLPLLLGLCMAATDFGRLFYHAVTVANAAGTAAFYGARDNVLTGDYAGQQQRADDDSRNIGSITTTAEQYCTCDDGTVIQDCNDIFDLNICPGYGPARAYVRVTVQQPFLTFAPWPMIPDSVTVSKTAFMRVQ